MTSLNPKRYIYLFLILIACTLSCNQGPHKQHIHKPSIHLVQFADLNNCNYYYYDNDGHIQSYVSTWLDKEFAFHIDSTTYQYDVDSERIIKSSEYRSYGYMSRKGKIISKDTLHARYVYDDKGNLLEARHDYDTVRYTYSNNLLICRETFNDKKKTWIDSLKYDKKGNNIKLATYWLNDGKYDSPTIENRRYDNKISYMQALPEAFRKVYSLTDVNNCITILCGNSPCQSYIYRYNARGYPVAGKAKGAAGIIRQDSIGFKYAKF